MDLFANVEMAMVASMRRAGVYFLLWGVVE
jgi:hypothetical protein